MTSASRHDPFPIIEVDPESAQDMEQLGAKRKFWFRRDADGPKWLFKADERVAGAKLPDASSLVGIGEDWSEKVACEICQLLGIPHVHYEMAVEKGTGVPGVICPNIAAEPRVLVLGNQLMLDRDPAYPTDGEKKYGVREHTVRAVLETVAKLEQPPETFCTELPSQIETAVDVFVGYVMLDALIANQDRHHQNWAAIREQDRTRLAPTFDHGAALARNEPDPKREQRLRTNDQGFGMAAFAPRARSSFYQDGGKKPISTIEAFQWFAARRTSAAAAWLDRLAAATPRHFEAIVDRVPEGRMSAIAREFTTELLRINRNRLLDTRG